MYIVDGVRTPIGKFGKSLKDYTAVDLAAYTIKGLLERADLQPSTVDFVVMGHVIRSGTGMNTAKQAALKAGIHQNVDAMNVDMVCASGMAAIVTGSMYIANGAYDIVIAGGMESMSNAPFIIPSSYRWGVRHFVLGRGRDYIYDAMVYEGLIDPILGYVMGEEADLTARKYEAPKDELDWIAYESHMRASRAWRLGLMEKYVAPIIRGGNVILGYDEGIRADIKLEDMKSLQPTFTKEGPHTVATSSQISDGAAVVLLASEDVIRKLGLEPKAQILGYSYVGVETWEFPVAPVYAIKKLLDRVGWSVDKVDFWENNEAFAVNSFLLNRILGIPYDRLNVHGGAIAIGHPLGASGARIIIELLNVLESNKGRKGIASICHGLGGAASIALELV